jgi:hypothetical protein
LLSRTSTCNVLSFRIEFWSSAAEVLMIGH